MNLWRSPWAQVLSWVSPCILFMGSSFLNPLIDLPPESSVFSSRKFSCQFSSLDGQKFGVSGHSHEWPNEGVTEATKLPSPHTTYSIPANFRQPLPLEMDGSSSLSPLAWRVSALQRIYRVRSAAALVFSLFLSSFPFFASDVQLKSNTLLTKARPYLVSISPHFQTEKTPVCRAIGFN